MDHLFTKIVAGEIPSYKIYEDELTYAFLDINPLSEGHSLVIPKKKYTKMDDVPPKTAAALGKTVNLVASAIKKATGARITIFCKITEKLLTRSPHVHFHIIPKKGSMGLGVKWEAQKLSEPEGKSAEQSRRCNRGIVRRAPLVTKRGSPKLQVDAQPRLDHVLLHRKGVDWSRCASVYVFYHHARCGNRERFCVCMEMRRTARKGKKWRGSASMRKAAIDAWLRRGLHHWSLYRWDHFYWHFERQNAWLLPFDVQGNRWGRESNGYYAIRSYRRAPRVSLLGRAGLQGHLRHDLDNFWPQANCSVQYACPFHRNVGEW